MLPINCKYSFVTVSDAIYSVLNCIYWNFIINTLHTCFKLINIFEFMSLELFLDYSSYIFNRVKSREWGGPVSISISQLLYHFKVSTDTCLGSLSIYRTNLFSKISLIFGKISETHLIYFFESMLPVKKTNGNFALREIAPYTLILWFPDFLCSSWNSSLGNTHLSLYGFFV